MAVDKNKKAKKKATPKAKALGNIPTSKLSTNKSKPKSVKSYGGVPMRKLKSKKK